MILLFYFYLITLNVSVFCDHYYEEYCDHNVTIYNTDKHYSLIKCDETMHNLEEFTLPVRKITVKNLIRFKDCNIPKKFKVSKITNDLGIKVTWLTFDNTTSLTKDNLVGFENLKHLLISKPNISNLEPDLLKNLSNLELLCLEDFKKIPHNFFKYSSKLKTLEIKFNDSTIRPDTFNGLGNLTHLQLKMANINYTKEDFQFDGFTSLKSLEIAHRTLNELPEWLFKSLINVETITVLFCFLQANLIPGVDDKQNYEIEHSKDVILPDDIFANLKSLKSLSLKSIEKKNLTENVFSKNFDMLQNLTIYKYHGTTLPEKIFFNTRNLKVLQITNNYLTSLPTDIFKNLKNLEFLDLSNNQFEKLDL